MSISSRTLKEHEFEYLAHAQIKAATLPNYHSWLNYMLHYASYALAVRMAVYVGCKMPGRDFYDRMQKRCQQNIEKMGDTGARNDFLEESGNTAQCGTI
jgi:hypothetical protein